MVYNVIYDTKFFTSKYRWIESSYLFISDNWEWITIIIEKEWRKVAILNWYETDKYDDIKKIFISKNWKSILLSVKKDWKYFFVKYMIPKDIIINNTSKLKILKNKLLKIKNWKKYINKLDTFIPKLKTEKLLKVLTKLKKLDLNNYKIKKYKLILDYIKYSILVELENR
jgi:hypothetical protein